MRAFETVLPPLTKAISVWLVDDDEEFTIVATAALSVDRGIACEQTFCRAEDAIGALGKSGQKPDVILLDIGLPDMNGLFAIEPMRKLSPSTHIVMLTVFDGDDKIMKAVAAGASGYLLKASSSTDVVNAIYATMSGGVPMHPVVVQKLLRRFSLQDFAGKDYKLTPKEKEVLECIVQGQTNESAATRLGISINTVDTHLKSIYTKLDVHTRSALANKVLRERII